jgi:hypothetical protein
MRLRAVTVVRLVGALAFRHSRDPYDGKAGWRRPGGQYTSEHHGRTKALTMKRATRPPARVAMWKTSVLYFGTPSPGDTAGWPFVTNSFP